MSVAVVAEFWRLIADLESHYAESLAFAADLVRILRLVESCGDARGPLCDACIEIVEGTRAAPHEVIPFLMWRLRWPEIRELAERLYDQTPPERRVFAVHLREVLDAYTEHPADEDLFLAWLAAAPPHVH